MSSQVDAGRARWVLPLCWTAVLLDGFDLVVLGSVLPVLLDAKQWGLTAASASVVSTVGLVGMTIGALAIGTITDVVGRRKALPSLGWRAMFVIGAAPALVLVPLMLRYLPESASFLRAAAPERKLSGGASAVASLFRSGFTRATLAFWVTSFMGLLLVYGLNTWLPQIMKSAGYPLGAALGLLLTLNVGAVIGLVVAGAVADRVGPRLSTIGWFAASAVFLAALSVKLPGIGVYVAVLIAGCFVFSSQVLVYAYIGHVYPAESRATGLGWSAGIGRIGAICGPLLGGAMLTAGIAYPWGFYAFAVVGVLGALGAAAVGRPATAEEFEAEPTQQAA
ncbi:MFS transporter [Saccharopolyspora sp. NPDC050642]|uniref:MFS transporter n=1 Tax=Saccharopolyspora sp. NPDC050642 TaxID=3157099 RepID=UPI0033FA1C43